MVAGWNIKQGTITEQKVDEERIWTLFNYVFSDSSKKRNTYKFGLIKSLLDNLFNGKISDYGVYYTYEEIFSSFAENYWNLVTKYHLRQMKKDGKSEYSKVETILMKSVEENNVLEQMEFSNIDEAFKKNIIREVTRECKRYVVGALYNDFEGVIYEFSLKEEGLTLNYPVYKFMLKYKMEIEKLNYYSWARFLETVNDDDVLIKVIDKLELSTPRRSDLSIYREILYREFEENRCFYCGKKLTDKIHVDHFIPWSFVKNDKVWNFVLSCPACNLKKNDKLPKPKYVEEIKQRNQKLMGLDNPMVQKEFEDYSEDLLNEMWKYAKMSGFKEQ